MKNRKISLIGPHKEICFSLIIDTDNITINNLLKCTIKGSESLQIIETLANRMRRNMNYISLFDASGIQISCSDQEIDLAVLKILTNGQSWYNSFGYFSDDETEEEHNRKAIDGYYEDFVLKLYEKIKERLKNLPNVEKEYTLKLKNIIDKCNQIYRPNVNQTVKNYFNHIWNHIKECKNKGDSTKYNWFAEYLEIIYGYGIIKYDRHLTKYIEMETWDW